MSSAEVARSSGVNSGYSGYVPPDILLSPEDRDILLDALATTFNTDASARTLLNAIDFPPGAMPTFDHPLDFWTGIFTEFRRGIAPSPYRRLLMAAQRRYGYNDTFAGLAQRYEIISASVPSPQGSDRLDGPSVAPVPAEHLSETCHIVFRADDEQQRDGITTFLAARGFEPQEVWSTDTAICYEVNEADQAMVRAQLSDLGGWTVVPPRHPDYLIGRFYVRGPDGRGFQSLNTPSSELVSDLAAEVVDEYPDDLPGRNRPAIVDQVDADGTGRRLDGDRTLYENGIGEESEVRVAFPADAAAVNPLDREEALFRVRNQLDEYAAAHPGFLIWPSPADMPTEYDLEFRQRSFGPPTVRGGSATDIGPDQPHELYIQLGPEFPLRSPRVFWLTDIFHPNVFPTYDCETLRQNEDMRGMVCLGTLSESYLPSMDFGELCETLVDIAAYRNYSLIVPGEFDLASMRRAVRLDYFDEAAALWAATREGQQRIHAIGGAPIVSRLVRKDRYPVTLVARRDAASGGIDEPGR
jgi:hypothetical protein